MEPAELSSVVHDLAVAVALLRDQVADLRRQLTASADSRPVHPSMHPRPKIATVTKISRDEPVDFVAVPQAPPTLGHLRDVGQLVDGTTPKSRAYWLFLRTVLADGKWRLADDVDRVWSECASFMLQVRHVDMGLSENTTRARRTALAAVGVIDRNHDRLRGGSQRYRPDMLFAIRLGTPTHAVGNELIASSGWFDDAQSPEDAQLLIATMSPTYRTLWWGGADTSEIEDRLGEDGEMLADE